MEKIQVVLASPSDLKEERMMIKELVESLNPRYMKNDICIDLRMWENSAPGMNDAGPQGLIDDDLEIPKADIFICMYWKKVGTIIPGEDVAGTEHELRLALENYNVHKKPDIKVFFKKYDKADETDETRKISEIAKDLQPKGLYQSFDDIDKLKDIIRGIFDAAMMKLIQKNGQVRPDIHKYIEISNTNEFVRNFESNNKLVLNTGLYDLMDFESEKNAKVFKEKVFDGDQLVISKISNVTIVGDNSTLLVSSRYAAVICFRNCRNIKLIGLTLGHTPYKGDCDGAVLRFENCSNIQLDGLELFGCGTHGIELDNCKNVKTNGVKIYECSCGGMSIIDSDIDFSNSMIYNCSKACDCIISATNSRVFLDNVSIFDNHTENFLIFIDDYSNLFCKGVCVYDNEFASLCNSPISSGLFENNNAIKCEKGFELLISSKRRISKSQYEEIKSSIGVLGRICESLFEEGRMQIRIMTPSYDSFQQIQQIVSKYENVKMTYDSFFS